MQEQRAQPYQAANAKRRLADVERFLGMECRSEVSPQIYHFLIIPHLLCAYYWTTSCVKQSNSKTTDEANKPCSELELNLHE